MNLYTYTDTFGGEPNFSWVRRVHAKSMREAKKKLDLTGVRFRLAFDTGDTARYNENRACRCLLVYYAVDPEA